MEILESIRQEIEALPRFEPEHGCDMGLSADGEWLDRDSVLAVINKLRPEE